MAYQQQLSTRKIEQLVKAHRDGETIDEAAVKKYTKVSSPEYLALYYDAFRESAGLKSKDEPSAALPIATPSLLAKSFVLIGINGVETELKIIRETSTAIALEKILQILR